MTRLLLSALALTLWAPAAIAADCAAVTNGAQAAAQADDLEALRQLYPQSIDCDPALRKWIGVRIARNLYNQASTRDPVDEAMLLAALDYGRSWQALATLGDLASSRHDYALAARRYQEALVEIADIQSTPAAPSRDVILGIRRQAEQAALLSPTYVASARGRDGSNAGLGAMQIRGIAVSAVALPIQFKFDSTDFTEAGIAAVEDLVTILKADRSQFGSVTLIGHTDATGDAGYNQLLSVRRAEAVRSYLTAHGVEAKIVAEGRGESEPYEPDDPGRYTQAERDQMSRRVELRRK